MAITIDHITKIISIPQSDLTLITGTLYKADTNAIHKALKVIMASEEGAVLATAHNHNTIVTLFGVVYARTIEILAPYSIIFSPDALWSVRLDGSNNNLGDVEAGILNQNQVQVIPTNSAGLQDLSTLLAAAYSSQVVINPITGVDGTSTPIGTFFKPSNNIPDTLTIANKNGIKNIILSENITINENLSTGFNLIGTSPFNIVTVNPGANLVGVSISNLTVQGELDGLNTIRDSAIMVVTNVSGFIEKCAFLSSILLTGDVFIAECYSNIPGSGYPTLINSPGCKITMRDFHGSIGLVNITDTFHSIQGGGGRIVIESSCTGGTIHVRGTWFEIVDNSGPGCTIIDERDNMEIRDNVISISSNTQI